LQTLERVGGEVRVFGGFASRLGIALMRDMGGDGSIDGGAIGAPFAVALYEAFWRGDFDEAKRQADAYGALMSQLINPDWSGKFGAPQAQIKACMALLGQNGGVPRPPLLPVDAPEDVRALRDILADAGLLQDAPRLAAG
jgi:4-hydroxy-tetrahydrodipicolinate synthase